MKISKARLHLTKVNINNILFSLYFLSELTRGFRQILIDFLSCLQDLLSFSDSLHKKKYYHQHLNIFLTYCYNKNITLSFFFFFVFYSQNIEIKPLILLSENYTLFQRGKVGLSNKIFTDAQEILRKKTTRSKKDD